PRIDERARELARAVGPEVEEDRRVAGPDPAPGRVADDDRLDELIRLARGVAGPQRHHGLVDALAGAVHDGVVRALHAVEPAVAVHGVVAAADRGDAGDAVQVARTAGGRRVAAVGERVHVHVLDVLPRRQLEQPAQVTHVAVDAAV